MVKRKESRDFDVFLGVFLVFGRERKCREKLGRRENFRKMCVSIWGVLGAIYSLGCEI